MKIKKAKLIIDIFMFCFLVVSNLPPKRIGLTVHIVFGSLLYFLMVLHIVINIKYFSTINKSFKKLKGKTKLQLVFDWILIFIFFVSFITSIFTATTNISAFERVHNIISRVGLAFLLAHIIQHLKVIGTYFKHTKQNKVAE